eukprot:2548553-Rhodomonas_salina.1
MPPVPPPRSSLHNSAPQAPHGVAPPSYLSPPKYSSQADAYPATVQATRSTPPMEMPPHSSPPKPTGKKAGVGVELQKDGNGHTVVLAVMPGGTAWASGQLSPGDNIVAVDYIETVGKDMHEVVGLIVGEPGQCSSPQTAIWLRLAYLMNKCRAQRSQDTSKLQRRQPNARYPPPAAPEGGGRGLHPTRRRGREAGQRKGAHFQYPQNRPNALIGMSWRVCGSAY